MAYGIIVKGPSGDVIVDTSLESGWTLIDRFTAPDTGSTYRDYADWDGYEIIGCGMVDGAWAGHNISTSGYRVNATRIVLDSSFNDRTNNTYVYVFVR